MPALTLYTGVVPAEGLTDALNGLIEQINLNFVPTQTPSSVQEAVSTATLTATSNTTLAAVTGLALAVVAGGTYKIRGQLQGTAAASGGIKAQFIASGGLTLTSANITGQNYNGTTLNTQTNVTALATDFSNSAAAYTNLYFDGTFVVNAAGTITIQAAQNTSNATSTTVAIGSYMELVRIS